MIIVTAVRDMHSNEVSYKIAINKEKIRTVSPCEENSCEIVIDKSDNISMNNFLVEGSFLDIISLINSP